jgi:hypothetical protein
MNPFVRPPITRAATPEEKAQDACGRRLSSLSKGDVVTVGRTRWRVFKNIGVQNFVERDGSKGRKLYRLEATSLDPCCIAVREVFGGSGELMLDKPAAAKGCATNGGTAWAGRR